ncbi:gpW family protein [Ancylobacter defluvii]|uniref:GpW protein n=1 Tax=Ancylobacter defluvii TaxID=1282440 RepID=A0A9W6JZB4_9HYPH|nr:gpW family protein [Ancylobacter defluvii]GLK84664.1 hypothetical protein GCM10017653_27340 [Ancylobacter defluvii]
MQTTDELLAEARTAYHRLQIGESAVEVRDSDGSSIRYTAANANMLVRYIKSLEAALEHRIGGPSSIIRFQTSKGLDR